MWAQVPVADAVFQEVRKVKAPLLTRACQRLLTEDRFAGALMFDAMRRPYVDVLVSSDVAAAESYGARRACQEATKQAYQSTKQLRPGQKNRHAKAQKHDCVRPRSPADGADGVQEGQRLGGGVGALLRADAGAWHIHDGLVGLARGPALAVRPCALILSQKAST